MKVNFTNNDLFCYPIISAFKKEVGFLSGFSKVAFVENYGLTQSETTESQKHTL